MIDNQWANNYGGDKRAIFAAAMETTFSEDACESAGTDPAHRLPAGNDFVIERRRLGFRLDVRVPSTLPVVRRTRHRR